MLSAHGDSLENGNSFTGKFFKKKKKNGKLFCCFNSACICYVQKRFFGIRTKKINPAGGIESVRNGTQPLNLKRHNIVALFSRSDSIVEFLSSSSSTSNENFRSFVMEHRKTSKITIGCIPLSLRSNKAHEKTLIFVLFFSSGTIIFCDFYPLRIYLLLM